MFKAFSEIRRNGLDFLLAALGGLTVTYAFGMSVASSKLATVFTLMLAITSAIGYLLSLKFSSKKALTTSAWLYVASSIGSPFVATSLNGFLPDGGFPRELIFSAGPLIWMLIIGGLFAWSDGTLSFQSVPVIALFGLVGAFNTFQPAVFLFFVFLVCAASLYARCHQRHMLDRAERSGYRHLSTLRQGPWKWMAGPEWALASGAAIVILSLIGAPVLQESVKNVAGVVRIAAPRVQPPPPVQNAINAITGNSTRVGSGPRGEISEEEVFRIKTPDPRYLRMAVYTLYDKGTWERYVPSPGTDARANRSTRFPFPSSEDFEKNFEVKPFEMKLTNWIGDKLPVPTPCFSVAPTQMVVPEMDGTIRITSLAIRNEAVVGEYASRRSSVTPTTTTSETSPQIERLTSKEGVTAQIQNLVQQLNDPTKTPYENAQRFQDEIERRAKYNLNAKAAPAGNDPAEYFLFGEVREGYCDLFATAMVLMARSANIPARYVVGFYPINLEQDQDGFYIIRKADAHAWAELYFEGFGWVPFDATEGAEAVPGGERGSSKDQIPWYKQSWAKAAQNVGLALIACAALFVMARGIQKLRPDMEPVLRTKQHAFEKFSEGLERATQVARHPSEGLREYMTQNHSAMPNGLEAEAQQIAEVFLQAFYGGEVWTQARASEVLARVETWNSDLKSTLKAKRPS